MAITWFYVEFWNMSRNFWTHCILITTKNLKQMIWVHNCNNSLFILFSLLRIIKAAYQEPFLVVAHSEGAFIWSVMEEFCCAALPSTSNITSISISRDFDNWGLLAVGSKNGLVNCYSLHWFWCLNITVLSFIVYSKNMSKQLQLCT